MPRYMLDTDVCSYIMKRSSAVLLKRLQNVAMDDVCVSVVTKAELLFGAKISAINAQTHHANPLESCVDSLMSAGNSWTDSRHKMSAI